MEFKRIYRIRVFCPVEDIAAIADGIKRISNCSYGNYQHVLWKSSIGVEEFQPLPAANATSGEAGETSSLPSRVLEFSIPRNKKLLKKVVNCGIVPVSYTHLTLPTICSV